MERTCAACGTTASVAQAQQLLSMGWKITRKRVSLCGSCVRRSDVVVRAAREMCGRAAQMRAQAAQMISDARGYRLPFAARRGFD